MVMKIYVIFLVVLLTTFFNSAGAGILDDVAKVVTAPITAPYEATKRVIEGDDPTKVITRPLHSGGRVIQQSANAIQTVNDRVIGFQRKLIRDNLGRDWERGFNLLTNSDRITTEMALTSGRYLGGCMQGRNCNPLQITAMPLAAALRDAYKVYWGYSVPLDMRLKHTLSVAVPPYILNSSRVVIGKTPNLTVPGFLNAANKTFGHDHAVTIGDMIIFSRFPQVNNCNDLYWFLHELQHVAQYMGYSNQPLEAIDGFSVEYVRNYSRVERNADNTADRWLSRLNNAYNLGCN